eukprot:TRINITY_DN1680_c0_g1_i1.p1 TRINITY_DN1680_c0_g1~~TRINITY_DN1680_c0_g1_i1.p1  ORF type:complete len:167 (-),score=32.87 TRINITY_DN1680_c0_g1_i1:26-526(-)
MKRKRSDADVVDLTGDGDDDEGDDVDSSIQNDEHNSEIQRLERVFEVADKEEIVDHLMNTLCDGTAAQIKFLIDLFPKDEFPDPNSKDLDSVHCVRCHEDYNEQYSSEGCIILDRAKMQEDGRDPKYLFEGRHTTEESDVNRSNGTATAKRCNECPKQIILSLIHI